jgi:hypothetical protein
MEVHDVGASGESKAANAAKHEAHRRPRHPHHACVVTRTPGGQHDGALPSLKQRPMDVGDHLADTPDTIGRKVRHDVEDIDHRDASMMFGAQDRRNRRAQSVAQTVAGE